MTRKRKIHSDDQATAEPKLPANGNTSTEPLNVAETSRIRRHFILGNGDMKLKILKKRRLADSANSAFVGNWYTSVVRDPSFASLSTDYPTPQSLFGYAYRGEPEVDRLDRVFGHPSKRNEHQVENEMDRHRNVHVDLVHAQKLFSNLSKDDGKMAAMGFTSDLIGWRQLPSSVSKILHEDDPKQAFVTAKMSNSSIQKLVPHTHVDWIDNHDLVHAPGKPIFHEFESARFGITDPPIPCCIFTKHRNGQISRCLREPVKTLHYQLVNKVVKKCLPFCWDKVQSPAICAFHHNVIEKEPTNTEANPYFARALGKHERTDYVHFTDANQFKQIGRYINSALENEKEENIDIMNFDSRLLKTLEPPRSLSPLREIRSRRLFDSGLGGKSKNEIDECIERAVERRKDFRSIPDCEFLDETDEESDEEDFELPAIEKERPAPSTPVYNSMFGMPNDELPEEERLLYKATEFDILDTTESPVVEVADRYKTLLDIQGYDDEAMRVFSNKNNATEAPKLNFEGISAASIRRIKKFYNLANRSGATSKNMLLEGLNEFFESKPVDEFKIAAEFMKTINERREAKIDHRRILLDNKNKRKMRQNKIEPSTSTSISFPMPLIGQLMESSKTYTHT